MGKHASPRRRRKMERRRPKLLSAEKKRDFFDQLDAFLHTSTSTSARQRRSSHNDDTGERSAGATHVVMTNESTGEPMGRGDELPNRKISVGVDGTDTDTQEPMARAMPTTVAAIAVTALTGTKRRAAASSPSSSTPTTQKTKRGKTRTSTSLDPQDLVLRGKRVLLVPIGSDVSRKRVEIWREMVLALGGIVVEHDHTTLHKAHQQQHVQLLHLHAVGPPGRGGGSTVGVREDKGGEVFDWSRVDIVVVSAQVDAYKLTQHYHMREEDLPSHLQLVTPDWLAYVRHEKKLPDDATQYEWRREVARVLQVSKHQEEEAQANNAAAVDDNGDDSDVEDDGSDRKNLTTNEIVRAPPVQVDTEKIQREEKEMQIKKERLVNERIPIFHELNPRFETIANANEGQKLKMEAFVCQKSSLMQANLNAHLTDPLEELMEFLHVERDVWREYSYKKIVSSLKAMRTRVSSVRDLKGLWWAKGRMRDKVVEVLETGKLEKLEAKKTNPRLRTLVEMSRIWGVGPATAAKLYNMGYKSMDALKQQSDQVLSFQQQIGLKHYHDFMTKIPRSEVEEIEKTVVDEIHRLVPNATALACGSYRRGKLASGDVDILITDPDSEECDILPELLRRLHAMGFLTDDLTHISDHRMGRCDSYMGVCRLREGLPFRRLDIKVYPRRYFGFALLYFTGSDHFNRSMRLFARKKGWSLSDRYLKRVVRVRKGVKLEAGESVVCPEEVDVFIALGLEYKDPTERNCFDIRFLEEDEAQAKHRKSDGDATEPAAGVLT